VILVALIAKLTLKHLK